MWVFLGMETIANIKYRSHVDSDSCLLAVCRWLIPHEVAPQQSFTMLQPANAKVIIKNGTTKNNHIYFILQFDPLKHSINNSSCNLTYTPKFRGNRDFSAKLPRSSWAYMLSLILEMLINYVFNTL